MKYIVTTRKSHNRKSIEKRLGKEEKKYNYSFCYLPESATAEIKEEKTINIDFELFFLLLIFIVVTKKKRNRTFFSIRLSLF